MTQTRNLLRVGDQVTYRDNFGSGSLRQAKVTGIDRTSAPWEKYGTAVQNIPWDEADCCCVDLDNGHWAYGEQLVRPALS